jgi:hypothetical protein
MNLFLCALLSSKYSVTATENEDIGETGII